MELQDIVDSYQARLADYGFNRPAKQLRSKIKTSDKNPGLLRFIGTTPEGKDIVNVRYELTDKGIVIGYAKTTPLFGQIWNIVHDAALEPPKDVQSSVDEILKIKPDAVFEPQAGETEYQKLGERLALSAYMSHLWLPTGRVVKEIAENGFNDISLEYHNEGFTAHGFKGDFNLNGFYKSKENSIHFVLDGGPGGLYENGDLKQALTEADFDQELKRLQELEQAKKPAAYKTAIDDAFGFAATAYRPSLKTL